MRVELARTAAAFLAQMRVVLVMMIAVQVRFAPGAVTELVMMRVASFLVLMDVRTRLLHVDLIRS